MKKIKIFHATLLYPSFIEKVYSKHPHLSSASYKTQLNTILYEGTGWLSTWSYYLNKVDDFELETCITNAKSAQLVWAQENKVKVNDTNWKEKVLVSQIQEYSPDILFAHDVWAFKSLLKQLKTIVPSIKLVFGWDGVLLHDLNLYKDYDLILSPVKETVKYYSENKKYSYEFIFGFQPTILKRLIIREPKYDCTFVGQIDTSGQHSERFKTLSELSKSVKIDLWTPSLGFDDWKRYYYHQCKRLFKRNFNEVSTVHWLRKMNHGEVYGLDMFQIIADSKIVLNKHINQSGNYAANIRLFEVTGAGSCIVTDYKDNLSDYFDVHNEIVTYRTNDELVSKVKYLLSHEEERNKIAKAGQRKTLSNHNYQLRFDEFGDYLKLILR